MANENYLSKNKTGASDPPPTTSHEPNHIPAVLPPANNLYISDGTAEEEALISLLQSGNPEENGAASGNGSGKANDTVFAAVRAIADRNKVLVVLEKENDPPTTVSILLSPDDTLKMARRLFMAAIMLPTPPGMNSIRTTLGEILKEVERHREKIQKS